ncbi:MAG: hypothetical protein WCX65_04905 [bacterium]
MKRKLHYPKAITVVVFLMFAAACAFVSAADGVGDNAESAITVPAPAPPDMPTLPLIPTVAPEVATGTVSQDLIMKTGSVVKVDAADKLKIYVDRGYNDGVIEGMEIEVSKMEPIKDMDGAILDEEEVAVGKIRAVEVKPRLTICDMVTAKKDFERGNIVRYYVESDKQVEKAADGKCPAGMKYDKGGSFVFVPGAMFATEAPKELVAETRPMCVDLRQSAEVSTWANADAACKRQRKRLCAREELQKVCSTWDKPKPCPKDMWRKNACPKQDTIADLYRDQEWTSDMIVDKNGRASYEANSCSCPGVSPVCTHCVYEGCRGARKPYRCCSEPIPAAQPAKKK